jgi:hypothetical protein
MEYQQGIDAVVVNYRTSRDLEEFLSSWEKRPATVPWDLWIVNIEPTSEDRAVAKMWAERLGEHAHVVEYGWNAGYAHAVNNASTQGHRETFVAFNADIILSDGALDDCHYALQQHDEWGVLGPRQVNSQGRITHAGIFGTLEKPEHRGWRRPAGDNIYTDVVESAISVSGSAYFVKREVWDQLRDCPKYRELIPTTAGAFLPTVLFYEESWCSVHALAHGYRVVYYGPVTIVHEWHQAIKAAGVENWATRVMKESHELFRTACDSHGIPHD